MYPSFVSISRSLFLSISLDLSTRNKEDLIVAHFLSLIDIGISFLHPTLRSSLFLAILHTIERETHLTLDYLFIHPYRIRHALFTMHGKINPPKFPKHGGKSDSNILNAIYGRKEEEREVDSSSLSPARMVPWCEVTNLSFKSTLKDFIQYYRDNRKYFHQGIIIGIEGEIEEGGEEENETSAIEWLWKYECISRSTEVFQWSMDAIVCLVYEWTRVNSEYNHRCVCFFLYHGKSPE